MTSYVWLLALGLALWFWMDSLRARELAVAASARACSQAQVQLLDEGVALRRLGIARDARGRVALRRHYSFDFSTKGTDRRRGNLVLIGARITSVTLDLPAGALIEAPHPPDGGSV